ncbi:MAG: NAD-dependent epimerase/dehydratase family protein [bacterium]
MTATKGTVLVTGSSGFLGYPVAKRLSAEFGVVGFDRKAAPHPPPTAECLYVDVTSEPSLARALDAVRDLHGNRLASVIHFAAYYNFSGVPSPLYEKVTVRGTQRLLRMLRERFTVEQFIFSSTMLVHAPTVPGRPITEDSALEPKWAYPQSKVATEKIIRAERGDTPAVILRIAGVYDDLGHSVPLPRQVQRLYERTPEAYLYPGDLTHGQAMIHLEDVLDLHELLVSRRQQLAPEVTLLVGEPKTMGYGELQNVIGRLIYGEPWRTYTIPQSLAKTGAWLQEHLPLDGKPFVKPWMIDVADDHYELDIARARKLLEWEPKRSLRATLPKIITKLLADPWAWYHENELPMPIWLQETEPAPAAEPVQEVYGADFHRLRAILEPHGHAHSGIPR